MIRMGSTAVGAVPPNSEFDLREALANDKDAAGLIHADEFADFRNSLTVVEKDYYLHQDLPKRVFNRLTSSDDI